MLDFMVKKPVPKRKADVAFPEGLATGAFQFETTHSDPTPTLCVESREQPQPGNCVEHESEQLQTNETQISKKNPDVFPIDDDVGSTQKNNKGTAFGSTLGSAIGSPAKRAKLNSHDSNLNNKNSSAILEFTELVHGHIRKISHENDEVLKKLETQILNERESLEKLLSMPQCFKTIKTVNQKKTYLTSIIELRDKLRSVSLQDLYRISIEYISKFRDCTSEEIRSNIILEFESRFCKTKHFPVHRCNILFCTECNSVLYLQPDDGVYICLDCGTTECQGDRLFITSVSNNGEDADILVNIDKKVSSFRDFLHNLQGKKQIPVVSNFIEMFKSNLIADGINPDTLSKKDVMEKLVATKNRKFSRFIDIIFSGLRGCDSVKMSLGLEIKFASRFQTIIDPYERHRPAYRKHFLSYAYCAWQFCRLEDKYEFMCLFKLLKDRKKIIQQDTIFKMICDELDWKFESPLSQKFCNYFIQ